MNAIVVLVNNIEFFETMLRNMPEQTDSELVIITETRVGDILGKIRKLLQRYKIEGRVFTSEQINKYMLKALEFTESGKIYLEQYTMGMNINVQYFLLTHPQSKYEKVLYLDDDVIINKDLSDLFKREEYASLKYLLSAGVKCENDERHIKWRKFAGCEFQAWLHGYINSGQRLYSRSQSFLKLYKLMLERFYNSEYFYGQWSHWKETGKNKYYAFFQDQNFETSVTMRYGVNNDNMKKYCRLILSIKNPYKDLTRYVDKHLTHYACGQYKRDFLELLRCNKVIK
jgi:hypothetical protein